MAPTPPSQGRLSILRACREGWIAFCRAPVPFLLFSLLSSLALGACFLLAWILLLPPHYGGLAGALPHQLEILITLAVLLGTWLVMMVSSLGFCRGAWMALEGRKPRFADLIRWNGAALKRLLLAWTAQQLVLLLPLGVATLLYFGLERLVLGSLWELHFALLILALAWFGVTQCFLNPLCLFREAKPFAAVGSGIRVVLGEWWPVVGLNGLLLALTMVVGTICCWTLPIVITTPLFCCINLAAYRQLFGAEDRLGLMKPLKPQS
jgi:hypothetical protein